MAAIAWSTKPVPHIRKPPARDPSEDWGAWTAAHFQNRDARDRFLRSVATAEDGGHGAEAVPDSDRGARVRWRPGRFLGLNDIVYAHGGRIVVSVGHHRIL